MNSFYIHDSAIVEDGASVDEGCKIWHFVHIREGATLGKNVIVGKSSYIDTGVIIGNNTKIQNLVSIYNGVKIGNNVFVGPHVAFTNDRYPRALGSWEVVNTEIKDGASIGANATILCGIRVGENALIAAGSVVISDVPVHGFVAGNPAKLKGYVCKCARNLLPRDAKPGNYSLTCNFCNQLNEFVI